MTNQTTICEISSSIAYRSYSRVDMEFTNVEICAVVKLSFVKGNSAGEAFYKSNSNLENGTLLLQVAGQWF